MESVKHLRDRYSNASAIKSIGYPEKLLQRLPEGYVVTECDWGSNFALMSETNTQSDVMNPNAVIKLKFCNCNIITMK